MNTIAPISTFEDFAQSTSAIVQPVRFRGMWFNEAIKDVPPQKWIVNRIIPEDALVVLFGPHGTAKTFITMDLFASVASRASQDEAVREKHELWRDYRVNPGGVIYIGAEGRAGLRKRFKAWANEKGNPGNIPLSLMTERVNLLDDADVQAFIEAAKQMSGEMEKRGAPLKVVVFDTLARCMPGGNENSSEHMGRAIDNADLIRRRLSPNSGGVTALFCHHSGKDAAQGARGHTSLPGAADTMIELSKDGSRLITARIGKQKDEEDGVKIHFRLQRVVIGENAWGGDETSCIVVDAEQDPYVAKNRPVLRGAQRIAYDLLTQAILDYGKKSPVTMVPMDTSAVNWRDWRSMCMKRGLLLSEDEVAQRKAFEGAAKHLRERGFIGVSDPWVWQARDVK